LEAQWTTISLKKIIVPLQFWNTDTVTFWKSCGVQLVPNISQVYLYRPRCMINVVITRDSSHISTWWQADRKLTLQKYLLPLSSKSILVDTVSHFLHTHSLQSSSKLHVSAQCGHHQVRIHVWSHWNNYIHRSFLMLVPINDKIMG
jgi:hypothetical protein